MSANTPIYSVANECHDCRKCIRQCPVKAIENVDGYARVMPEGCISCGHCVAICPSGAKRVRDDVKQAKTLLSKKSTVLISLAPSYVSEFPDIPKAQLIAACRSLGFFGVSETALGAQQVSAQLGRLLDEQTKQVFLSSACPVAVKFVQDMLPQLAERITPLSSPMIAHGKMLRAHFGEDIGIVFVGPCIAKKMEAKSHPDTIDVALTFENLRQWFSEAGIVPNQLEPSESDIFLPYPAEEGAVYPIDGGMNEATRANCKNETTRFVNISGIKQIADALGGFAPYHMKNNLCLELLACDGGCINGPGTSAPSTITARLQVQDNVAFPPATAFPRPVEVEIMEPFDVIWSEAASPNEEALRDALLRIGKQTPSDELNCGGCGYDTCRDFATAMLSGKTESNMCISYMRQLAEKKVNLLFRTMPYGVVIVDKQQKIIECNERFAFLAGQEILEVYQSCPSMEGAELGRIFPFTEIFQHVLDTQEEIIRRNVRFDDRWLSISVFNIEPHLVVGAILLDVTETEGHREEIITKARLVIKNTLANAQEIAFLIGKNAAESECILNSVIEGFLPPPEEEEP